MEQLELIITASDKETGTFFLSNYRHIQKFCLMPHSANEEHEDFKTWLFDALSSSYATWPSGM